MTDKTGQKVFFGTLVSCGSDDLTDLCPDPHNCVKFDAQLLDQHWTGCAPPGGVTPLHQAPISDHSLQNVISDFLCIIPSSTTLETTEAFSEFFHHEWIRGFGYVLLRTGEPENELHQFCASHMKIDLCMDCTSPLLWHMTKKKFWRCRAQDGREWHKVMQEGYCVPRSFCAK